MGLTVDVPGSTRLQLEHLLLDVNGTLTERGELIQAVEPLIVRLCEQLHVLLLSADTFGQLDALARRLNVPGQRVTDGSEKARILQSLGAGHCAAIGNGANDAAMLEHAVLGIAATPRRAHSSARTTEQAGDPRERHHHIPTRTKTKENALS